MVGGLLTGKVPQGVTGPIGIYEATSSIKKNQGMLAVIHFFGIVSVNLAVVNVLPFPALDGGKVLFLALEAINRKKVVREEIENIIHMIGFTLLILLFIAITYKDIRNFF